MKALSLFLLCLPVSVSAQDLMQRFEMPAHRALMAQSAGAELTPFASDGCSGGLSASWRWAARQFPRIGELYEEHPPWEYCCVIHDRAYHDAGGASEAEDSYDLRLSADRALRTCVTEHGERHATGYAERFDMTPDQIRGVHAITADAMYGAVRIGGGPCSGLPWRWGFGYPGCSVLNGAAPARE